MKKVSMRFCQRNLKEEGSGKVLEIQLEKNEDLVNSETHRCLGHCTICNQGPFCALNDLLFQEDNAESLNRRLDGIFNRLRDALSHRGHSSH